MNIVTPYAKILTIHGNLPSTQSGINALRFVEWCGRISHASEDAQTEDSWERFIRAVVLQHGDWSITEHANVSVDFLVDRGVTHELCRHRLCAFTQSSTRFINHVKKVPPSFIDPLTSIAPSSYGGSASVIWDRAINTAEQCYRDFIEAGCAPQIARSVFPNALASRIVVTANLRNWRHVLLMRTCKEAHPQMRQVMIPLLSEFKEKIPILYEDIEAEQKQSIAIARGR